MVMSKVKEIEIEPNVLGQLNENAETKMIHESLHYIVGYGAPR